MLANVLEHGMLENSFLERRSESWNVWTCRRSREPECGQNAERYSCWTVTSRMITLPPAQFTRTYSIEWAPALLILPCSNSGGRDGEGTRRRKKWDLPEATNVPAWEEITLIMTGGPLCGQKASDWFSRFLRRRGRRANAPDTFGTSHL